MLKGWAISCDPLFKQLWADLEELPPFEAMPVEPYLPESPLERYKFLRTLQDDTVKFPSPACIYMHYTGNRGYISQIWKVASLADSELALAQARAIKDAESTVETKYSRAAFKQYVQKLCFVTKDLSAAQLRIIFEEITGWKSKDGDSQKLVLQRLQSILRCTDEADGLAEFADFRIDNGKAR